MESNGNIESINYGVSEHRSIVVTENNFYQLGNYLFKLNRSQKIFKEIKWLKKKEKKMIKKNEKN